MHAGITSTHVEKPPRPQADKLRRAQSQPKPDEPSQVKDVMQAPSCAAASGKQTGVPVSHEQISPSGPGTPRYIWT